MIRHYIHHGLVGAALFAAGWWMRACHDHHHR